MPAAPSHTRPAALPRFLFGATYYPEHWDKETRAADPDLMAAAGFNAVRMAEFAWDLMEPEEGRYDFSLFDEAIAALGEKGISTILCTPTATPPRWLTIKHPEIQRVDAAGTTLQHGSRQHCCYANRLFREYSRGITRVMAKHYRGNRHVTGWQTDNEFMCHFAECHCPECQVVFRDFLKEKFSGDIDALNRAWGTAFWAQTYRAFDEIITPKTDMPTHPNPAHVLDYHRYISWAVAAFQHDQVSILRQINPDWFITHNGMFRYIDYRRFARDLDVLGYDVYPSFNPDPGTRRFSHAFGLDRTRAWSGNFIIPEHLSGPGGQRPFFLDNPEPGEVRRMTYSSLARGADGLLYFRWRSCRFGAEEYWCGILDHDNVPRRRLEEITMIGRELKTVGPELMGTSVIIHAAVASADNLIHSAWQSYSLGLPSPDNGAETVHGALMRAGYAAGCVHPSDDLSGLKLYVIPHWEVFDPAWVPGLEAFVRNGGTLIIGARTATRDLDNNVVADTLPGMLRQLAGVSVEEYGKLNRPDLRPYDLTVENDKMSAEHWYELLQPDGGTDILAAWSSRHVKGKAAVTAKKHGRGMVIYVGTYFTAALAERLLPLLAEKYSLRKIWSNAPDGIEVVRRQAADKSLWFFINHNETATVLPSLPDGTDLISGKSSVDVKLLEPNGVAVIKTNDR